MRSRKIRGVPFLNGNIWPMYDKGATIVVTTNIGWAGPPDFRNNMGAGLILQALRRYPQLDSWYGKFCREHGADTPVVHDEELRLVFFPVKPLLVDDPEFSWDQSASLELIERSARQLNALTTLPLRTYLTLPGCGNGSLDPRDVAPILDRCLDRDRFTIVDHRAAPDWKPPAGRRAG